MDYIMKEKKDESKYIHHFRNIILDHKNDIWYPKIDLQYNNINTNSCFNILSHTFKDNHINEINFNDDFPETG